ncbi:DivIVA domain-containing protein [Desulfosporosinus sp.]|uniref:DivIVA domain-containing protein n=1 Tax=Desulfosporosinus sp. TaxID=157907 RepID=UPI00230954E6|nr:DivIVA domain-containing protein [Desulfosporosinus sp.]MCO5386690.1 DivIVA domain-containing protein [Desulfosporosinus sp.]MDA8222749.1 DivIVA domain-containing protein [Desulfitobacterium hafniense]
METPEFKRGFRGYDSDAVDQAWAESERQLSEANAANKELRLQINSLREQNSEWGNRLKYYEQIEKDLRDALVSAQRIASQVKDEATIQAEELLQSARSESEVILSEAVHLSESKEIEADNMLIEKRMEIVQLEEQIQGLIEQKTELQTLADQVRKYLDIIKDLIM